MKKFRITSPHITGSLDFTYNSSGKLCMIDAMNADITPEQMKLVLSRAEVDIANIGKWFSGTQAHLVEIPLEVSFDLFWTAYGRKINKLRCMKLWSRLSDHDKTAAIIGIGRYNHFLQRENWRSKADADTYLRNKYWENQY